MTFDEIRNIYTARRVATRYILGYEIGGDVFFTVLDKLPDYCMKQGYTSSKSTGETYAAIRFRPTKKEKLMLIGAGPTYKLGTLDSLKDETYNRGDMFEKAIWEFFGQTGWTKNSTPFYEGADIILRGEPYEIKFQDGTYTDEHTCMKILGLI